MGLYCLYVMESTNAKVEVTQELKARAANEVLAKQNEGFGKSNTTLSSMSDEDVENLYETGALGEVVFAEWAGRQGFDVTHMPRGHDYDFEVNGKSIDVKATASGLTQIEISERQVGRKDETPDFWVKVDVTGRNAEVVGFIRDDDYRSEKNEVDSV